MKLNAIFDNVSYLLLLLVQLTEGRQNFGGELDCVQKFNIFSLIFWLDL